MANGTVPAPAPAPAGDRPSDPVRVLYVGGNGRSGSTLLGRVLGCVPGLVSVGEFVFVWSRGLSENQLCGCGQPFRQCPFWLAVGERAFGGWDQVDLPEALYLQHAVDRHRYIPLLLRPSLSRRYEVDLARYRDLLQPLYRAIRDVSGAEIVVDTSKHPSYGYLLRRLSGLDLRAVHLIRISHGVCYSWTKRVRKPEVTGSEEYMNVHPPTRMALEWTAFNGLMDGLAAVGVPTFRLRYEDFIAAPQPQLQALLEFAGRPTTAAELDFVAHGEVELPLSHSLAGNPMRFRSGPQRLKVDEQWRTQMPQSAQRLVTALTMPGLLRYGYLRPGLPLGGHPGGQPR